MIERSERSYMEGAVPESGDAEEVPERPRSREDVIFRELADEWVLFDPDTRRLHVLNLTAALVWSFCTGEHRVDEIARRVWDSFDEPGDPEAVEMGVRDALRTFSGEGLLTGRGDSGGEEAAS